MGTMPTATTATKDDKKHNNRCEGGWSRLSGEQYCRLCHHQHTRRVVRHVCCARQSNKGSMDRTKRLDSVSLTCILRSWALQQVFRLSIPVFVSQSQWWSCWWSRFFLFTFFLSFFSSSRKTAVVALFFSWSLQHDALDGLALRSLALRGTADSHTNTRHTACAVPRARQTTNLTEGWSVGSSGKRYANVLQPTCRIRKCRILWYSKTFVEKIVRSL